MTSHRAARTGKPRALRGTRAGHARLALALPPAWVALAACRDTNPDLFFPVTETGPGARQARTAKAVCAACPVAARCLTWALDTAQPHGIWGGHTPTERATLRPRPARPPKVDHPDLDAHVLALRADGLSLAAIATHLGRSLREITLANGRAQKRRSRQHRRHQEAA